MRFRNFGIAAALAVMVGVGFSATAHARTPAVDCQEDMICRTVTVPLDWTGKQKGKLGLDVRLTGESGPVLLHLFGGPGQAGSPYAGQIRDLFARLAPNYRIIMFDQRGTGTTAVRCNGLQGLELTDITVRPRNAVRQCGKSLGTRRGFYSTTATVRDIEAIREALGVKRMAVMGTSYGTLVATRYARAFPNRVSRLVLDSVVPQEGVDPLLRVHMRRAAKVLRWECGVKKCGLRSDPASDLARLVAKRPYRGRVPGTDVQLTVNGPALLDWTTTVLSFMPKDIPAFARGINRAVHGDYRILLRVAHKARGIMGVEPAELISWGLHAATLCADSRLPFSIGSGNRKGRTSTTRRYLAREPKRSFWPFDMSTALGNGLVQTCVDWPITKVAPQPKPGKVRQPTLFLAGQYDLSTPVEYVRRELRRAPKGKLVVVPRLGHAVAFKHECAVKALSSFLDGRLKRSPCEA